VIVAQKIVTLHHLLIAILRRADRTSIRDDAEASSGKY
jgi:hypothetical protein